MNAIQITAKLYEARDAMRFLFGDRYEDKVKTEIVTLRQLAAKWNCSPVQAIARAGDELSRLGDNGVGLALMLAAYVEDAEGTYSEKLATPTSKLTG